MMNSSGSDTHPVHRLAWLGVIIFLLFVMVVVIQFFPSMLTGLGGILAGMSIAALIGYIGGGIFLLIGAEEVHHAASEPYSRPSTFFVPGFFLLVGILMMFTTWYYGQPGDNYVTLEDLLAGLVAIAVIGVPMFWAIELYDRSHPVSLGTTASGGSHIGIILVLILMVALLYFVYSIVQALMNFTSCGHWLGLLCGI